MLPATRDKDSEGKCSCVCWRARRLGGRRGGQNLMPQGRVIRHNKWRHKKPGGKYGWGNGGHGGVLYNEREG